MVRRHRCQHPRHLVEQPAPDKVSNRIWGLHQLDHGRASTGRRPEDVRDDKLGNIVDLVKIPLKSTSLFMGLGQFLRISVEGHLVHLQVLLQHLHLSTQL